MPKELKTVLIAGYLNSTPEIAIIVYEKRGLGLARRMSGNKPWFEVVHLNTSLPIGITAHRHPGAYKTKRIMKAFLDTLAEAYDWDDWAEIETPPIWADAAYKLVKGY